MVGHYLKTILLEDFGPVGIAQDGARDRRSPHLVSKALKAASILGGKYMDDDTGSGGRTHIHLGDTPAQHTIISTCTFQLPGYLNCKPSLLYVCGAVTSAWGSINCGKSPQPGKSEREIEI